MNSRAGSFTPILAILAMLMGPFSAVGAATAPADDALGGLPPGADAIGCLSLLDARNDPGFQKKFDRTLGLIGADAGKSLARFQDRTRIDLNKDVDSVTFAVCYPPAAASNDELSFAVIARGRFQKEAIAAAAEQMAAENGATATRKSQDGTLELVFAERGRNGATDHLAFPNDGEMVFATTTDLFHKTMRALKPGPAAAADADPAYGKLLRGVKRDSLFWAVGAVPRELRSMAVAPPAANDAGGGAAPRTAPAQAEHFVFTLDATRGLSADLAIAFDNAAGAQAAQSQLNLYRSILGIAVMTSDQMTPQARKTITEILQKMAVSVVDATARAALSLNPAEYEALFAALENDQSGNPAPVPRAKRAPGRPAR